MTIQLEQPTWQTARRVITTALCRARGDPDLNPRVVRASRCTCTTTTTISPTGESIVVFRVSGGPDLSTVGFLPTALTAVCRQPPDHPIVDLAELDFCSASGLIFDTDTATRAGTRYAIGAVSPQLSRCWDEGWPHSELPTRFATAAVRVAHGPPSE
jgi:anti-anti-sigma regulatory factor